MEGIEDLIVFKILVNREKFVEFPRYNVFREFCFQLLISWPRRGGPRHIRGVAGGHNKQE